MTTHIPALLLAAAVTALGPQSGTSTPPSSPQKPAAKTLTLSGCVQLDPSSSNSFTLSDKATGSTYRLTGGNVKSFVWRNVRIVGGLVPSATLAAQAGSVDPTKAAVASQSGSRPAPELPHFQEVNVLRVRPTGGTCTPPAK
jgi:hypothetical protein